MGIWKGGRSLRTLLGVQAHVPTGLEPLWALGGDLRTSRQTGCPQGRGAARPGPPRPPTTFSLPPRPLPPPGQPRPCSVRSNLFWAGPAARGGFQLFLHALLHRKAHSLSPPSLLLHTHTHTHTHTPKDMCIHTHTHGGTHDTHTTYMCRKTRTFTYAQTQIHIYTQDIKSYTYTHSETHTYIHTRYYSHIHTHTQTHTHIYTRIDTDTIHTDTHSDMYTQIYTYTDTLRHIHA